MMRSKMTYPDPVKIEAIRHQRLKEHLLSEYPEIDADTLRDTLAGITRIREMIAAIIRSALVDEALQLGLRTRIEDMRERLSRLAERGLKKRRLALEAMNEAGLKKLEQPDFTASARVGAPPLVVTAEQSIPEAYWIPQPPKLNRPTLTANLRRG